MKRAILVALGTGALISSAAAIGIGMSDASPAERMSRAQFEHAIQIAAQVRQAALTLCQGLAASEGEVCRTEADAHAATRVADLEAEYLRTQEAARKAQKVRIDSRYQVRRAHCQSLGGFKRDKCLVSAHAERGRALLDVAAPYAVRYTH